MQERQEGMFYMAWMRAGLPQTKFVAFLEVSVRILIVRLIHCHVQNFALR